jgi:multiple sugar transport system permease protein
MTLALIKLRNIAADRPNIVLTGAAIAILPPMIVFIIAQRYFIEGIAGSAVKG